MLEPAWKSRARVAAACLQRGDVAAAERLTAELLESDDQLVEAWGLASEVALRQGRLRDAAIAANRAAILEPDNAALHARHAQCLVRAGDCQSAIAAVNHAMSAGAQSAEQLNVLAAVLFHCEHQREALDLYKQACILEPTNVETARGLALAYRAIGDIGNAESAADKAISLDPRDYEMVHLRSSLRRQSAEFNHVEPLKRALSAGIPNWRGNVQIGYALAKELEDLGRYEESFGYLERAATLKRRHTDYDIRQDLNTLEQIRASFDLSTLTQRRGSGCASEEPIFILGLPRTGSTLVERILSNHPDVKSAGERNDFALELVKLTTAANDGRPVPKAELPLAATQVDFEKLGKNYIQATRPWTGRVRHFIDKMPMNALYIGYIHLALPRAKIVLVERDPADTCYAMYKFLFQNAYPFSYDLRELGLYFLAHRKLMDHWETLLPKGVIHRVQYEELVAQQQAVSRRLIGELGLPWNDACLDFEANAQVSTTGSAAQVRQRIYRSSVGLWKQYREQLKPMLQILESGTRE